MLETFSSRNVEDACVCLETVAVIQESHITEVVMNVEVANAEHWKCGKEGGEAEAPGS